MTTSKYLKFELKEEKTKTKVYAVVSKMHNYQLGIIKWFSMWRCYAFWPDGGTIWNANCLDEIKIFLNELMVGRKK
jgi:hypothetical protein